MRLIQSYETVNYLGVFQILRKAPQAEGLESVPCTDGIITIFPSSTKVNKTHPNYFGSLRNCGVNRSDKACFVQ